MNKGGTWPYETHAKESSQKISSQPLAFPVLKLLSNEQQAHNVSTMQSIAEHNSVVALQNFIRMTGTFDCLC